MKNATNTGSTNHTNASCTTYYVMSALVWFVLGIVSTLTCIQIFTSSTILAHRSRSSECNCMNHNNNEYKQDASSIVSSTIPTMNSNNNNKNNINNTDIVWISEERKKLYNYQKAQLRINNNGNNYHNNICGRAPQYDQFFNLPIHNRSGDNEDKTIYELFFQKQQQENYNSNINNSDYYYLELGAFNGHKESNTRFFDDCLHWNGILIEANPMIYNLLIENRPHAHRFAYAASCSIDDELDNKTVGFWQSWWTNAVQDISVGRAAYADKATSTYVEVPCGSLTPVILDIIPNHRIHFLSLDVEGVEPEVLENIDFHQIFIDILIVENRNTYCPPEPQKCESRNRARSILVEQNGYLLYPNIVQRSDLYVHPKSQYASILDGKMQATIIKI